MKRFESWPGFWRIDSGEYRAVFTVDDAERVVWVERIRYRRDVYRNL